MTTMAACYVRVSTDRQTVENQRADVEQLARARSYEPITYEETESAAKARPVFERMLTDARAGRVRAVFVWSLDRLGRNMAQIIATVQELDGLGVRVASVRDGWMDTSGPVRDLLFAIFGWVAQFERTRLIERTRAGLDRAKAQGKRLGRPPASLLKLGAAARAVARGDSIYTAARDNGLSESTLARYLAREAVKKGGAAEQQPPHDDSST